MAAYEPHNQRVEVEQLDTGVKEIEVDAKEIDAFFQEGHFGDGVSVLSAHAGASFSVTAPTHPTWPSAAMTRPRRKSWPSAPRARGVAGVRPRNK